NKMFGHIHPRIEVVNVQELFNGKRLTFPTSIEVLKKAERKSQNDKELFI
ncbi:MAG: hypothetical protein RI943_1183, partial [Bacteroidota bacterium]